MTSIYKTTAINETTVPNQTRIKDGLALTMTPPLDQQEGSNPEQLLAMSWATCLNATTQALLKARKLEHNSRVRVEVDLHKEANGVGFYFSAYAYLAVEGFTLEESERLVRQAHERCPVSKLIHGNEHVDVFVESY
ncbi:OsmC family protein [Erysipelothrix rhusiopathiae]|nr:OsmC family protein [Erysipelothrix rhusiopathiae]